MSQERVLVIMAAAERRRLETEEGGAVAALVPASSVACALREDCDCVLPSVGGSASENLGTNVSED